MAVKPDKVARAKMRQSKWRRDKTMRTCVGQDNMLTFPVTRSNTVHSTDVVGSFIACGVLRACEIGLDVRLQKGRHSYGVLSARIHVHTSSKVAVPAALYASICVQM